MSHEEIPSAEPQPPPPRPEPPPPAASAGAPAAEGRGEAIGADPATQFLEESGEVKQELIEAAAMDVKRDTVMDLRLAQEQAGKPETFFSDLIHTLTHLRYPEPEARQLWANLLTHKYNMSYGLGRNVGIRVAALDYFRNVLRVLDDVKIIGASAYIETAQLAVTDGLTGLFNHRYFQDRLQREVSRIKEEGGCLTLMMLDIDYFKMYNDINGHIAGDVALKEVSALLRRNVKRDDVVARYGGEEFALILLGLDRYPGETVATRIREVIEATEFPNANVLPNGHLTVSIGLAECPADADERAALIAAADRGLYVAKRRGRNRTELAAPDPRRDRRVPLARMVRWRPADAAPEAPWEEGQTLNLSTGGLCMLARGAFAVGQSVVLEIEPMRQDRALHGRVAWQTPRIGDLLQVGVEFVALAPEDAAAVERLMAY